MKEQPVFFIFSEKYLSYVEKFWQEFKDVFRIIRIRMELKKGALKWELK